MPIVADQLLHTLRAMRASLSRFSTEAESAVNRMWSEVQQTRAWLNEREQDWRIQIAQCERTHEDASLDLRRCQDSRKISGGERTSPNDTDCSEYQLKLRRAATRLAEAQQALNNVRHQRKRFEEVVVSYQLQRQRLRSFLFQDVTYAGILLNHSIATVENYFQGRVAAQAGDFFHKTSTASAVSMVGAVETPNGRNGSAAPHAPDPGYFRDAEGRQMVVYVFQWGDLHMVRVYNRKTLVAPPKDPTLADVGMADFALEYDDLGQPIRGRILGLIVMPMYRNRRTGSRMLAVVERIIQHYGAHEAYGALPEDTQARDWFAKRGYRLDPDRAEIAKEILVDAGGVTHEEH